MKTFLAVYMGTMSGEKMAAWRSQDEQTRKEREASGMQAWMEWGQRHADAIVEDGGPLGKTKLVDANGIALTKNAMTGYTIVRAESHDKAAEMFVNYPNFAIFPGESVEIMECLPMPEM